jgi:hypothetical protein
MGVTIKLAWAQGAAMSALVGEWIRRRSFVGCDGLLHSCGSIV